MKSKIFLVASIFIFSVLNLFAQDSTKEKSTWDWEFDEFDEWNNNWEKQPTISLQYGFSGLSLHNISTELNNPSLAEIQLGHTKSKSVTDADYLLRYYYHYLFISLISTDLTNQDTDDKKIDSKTWRFGFARSGGYGYKAGNAAIIPYYTYSLDWSRVNFKMAEVDSADQRLMKRFDESFRFGTSNEGGIRMVVATLISFEASYQRSIVFERHLFWKWASSAIIEIASQGLLDTFIKEILDSSPAAGPIVYFILKNALGYGLYELRQTKMNWPFAGAAPLAFDSFRFGITFTF